MASATAYAALVAESMVINVIVIPYLDDDDATITAWCNNIGLEGDWLDCSYLGARRGCYPGIGYTYDPVADVFVPPNATEAP